MIYSENYQPLAWYDNIERQYHNKYRSFGQMLPIFIPDGRIIPFQIPVPGETNQIVSINAVSLGGATQNITTALSSGGNIILTPADSIGIKNIICLGNNAVNLDMGIYYLTVVISRPALPNVTLYSEIINVCENVGLLKINYWDDADRFELPKYSFRGFIDYQFKFSIWLKGELGKPLYVFEDTIVKRNGVPFPEEIISAKRYQFELLSGEPFLDGLRLVRCFTYIELVDREISLKVYNMDMEVEWDEVGYVAATTIQLDTGNIIRKIGAARSFAKDFNKDFSNDYF